MFHRCAGRSALEARVGCRKPGSAGLTGPRASGMSTLMSD